MAAIITIVHILTAILAGIIIVAHCVAIFWPRKSMAAVVDSEGRPVVWRNETEKRDVACVWWEEPEGELAAEQKSHTKVPKVASFSSAIQPLSMDAPVKHRSVA